MAIGAGWAGARSMTSTSGPGISLMAEFAGSRLLRRGAGRHLRHPAHRALDRPSDPHLAGRRRLRATRCPTATPGTWSCCPATVEECYQFAREAFDYADRFQTPVFVLSDLDLGMNLWMTPQLQLPGRAVRPRQGAVEAQTSTASPGEWARYRDVDGDGVTYRTLPGTDHPRRRLLHPWLRPRRVGALHGERRGLRAQHGPAVAKKLRRRAASLPAPVVDDGAGIRRRSDRVRGTTHASPRGARRWLAERGLPVDYLRVRALPLHSRVAAFVARLTSASTWSSRIATGRSTT